VRIKIHGEKIDAFRFADDIAIITNQEEDLQNIMQLMNRIMATEFNMKISKTKTKILVCYRNETISPQITLDNDTLQQIDEYKYLGNIITSDERCTREIKNRIGQAKCAFYKKKGLLTSNNIDLKVKKNLLSLLFGVCSYMEVKRG